MRTTFMSDKVLNHAYRNTAWTSPTTVYASLLTAVTDAEAGTVTEASYGSYARVAAAFGAPGAGGGGRKVQNSGTIAFPQRSNAGTENEIAVGIWDALTVGNLLDIIYLDGADPIAVAVVDAGDISSDLIVSPAHGLTTDQQVRFEAAPDKQTLPAGLSENTTYFVIAAGATADRFSVSTTQGGGAVNITAAGRGLLMKLTPKPVTQNDTPQFAANALTLYDD